MIKVFSKGIKAIPGLEIFLSEEIASAKKIIVGWGHKKTALKARQFAEDNRLDYLSLEDGFLRSVGLGFETRPLSLSVDPIGVYYDSTCPSYLEELINTADKWLTSELRLRSRKLIKEIISRDLSKYNIAPSMPEGWLRQRFCLSDNKRCVLVVDQTKGDASVQLGQANSESFARMLKDAIEDNPESSIIVKCHPDVICGKKDGYFQNEQKGICYLTENFSPLSTLEQVDKVYVVTSQLGFDALLLGKEVHVYGMPFYAGWGLTKDSIQCERRTRLASIEEIFAAAYIRLCRYLNPVKGKLIEIEEYIELLDVQHQMMLKNAGKHVAVGFKYWKKPHLRAFLSGRESSLQFVKDFQQGIEKAKEEGADLNIWSSKVDSSNNPERHGIRLTRVEDGFIRSAGLGSDFNLPYSLVLDHGGIYYDPNSDSDLFRILSTIQDRKDIHVLRSRVERLRKFIVEKSLTKYNIEGQELDLKFPVDRKTILVVGQVEDDASIRLGCKGCKTRTNTDLLKRVRHENPDAFILFKTHPDVLSGNRKGKISEEVLKEYSDISADHYPMGKLLVLIDELHTLTSLSGFEAILRNKKVVVYGKPFYAGWGLTTDKEFIEGRGKNLTSSDLIAGTLLLYPRYWDWQTMMFCRPEDICERLSKNDQADPGKWIAFCRGLRKLRSFVEMSK